MVSACSDERSSNGFLECAWKTLLKLQGAPFPERVGRCCTPLGCRASRHVAGFNKSSSSPSAVANADPSTGVMAYYVAVVETTSAVAAAEASSAAVAAVVARDDLAATTAETTFAAIDPMEMLISNTNTRNVTVLLR